MIIHLPSSSWQYIGRFKCWILYIVSYFLFLHWNNTLIAHWKKYTIDILRVRNNSTNGSLCSNLGMPEVTWPRLQMLKDGDSAHSSDGGNKSDVVQEGDGSVYPRWMHPSRWPKSPEGERIVLTWTKCPYKFKFKFRKQERHRILIPRKKR